MPHTLQEFVRERLRFEYPTLGQIKAWGQAIREMRIWSVDKLRRTYHRGDYFGEEPHSLWIRQLAYLALAERGFGVRPWATVSCIAAKVAP